RVEHVFDQRQTGEAREGIVPPRAEIDAVSHRLAELAVTGHVDAERLLMLHHVDRGGAKLILKRRLVTALALAARTVGEDQSLGTRQTAGVTRENAVAAGTHRFLPYFVAAMVTRGIGAGNKTRGRGARVGFPPSCPAPCRARRGGGLRFRRDAARSCGPASATACHCGSRASRSTAGPARRRSACCQAAAPGRCRAPPRTLR